MRNESGRGRRANTGRSTEKAFHWWLFNRARLESRENRAFSRRCLSLATGGGVATEMKREKGNRTGEVSNIVSRFGRARALFAYG